MQRDEMEVQDKMSTRCGVASTSCHRPSSSPPPTSPPSLLLPFYEHLEKDINPDTIGATPARHAQAQLRRRRSDAAEGVQDLVAQADVRALDPRSIHALTAFCALCALQPMGRDRPRLGGLRGGFAGERERGWRWGRPAGVRQ